MNVKALHAGGWHDIFLKGSIKNFVEHAQERGDAGSARRAAVAGRSVGARGTSPEGKIGDVVFGKQAVLDMNATIAKWGDFALKGMQERIRGRRSRADLRDGR